METKLIQIEEKDILTQQEEALLREAGDVLRRGGLVAFPTETVYGLGGDALNPDSARKIYAAKGRPSDNPLIVHICRLEDIYSLVAEFTEEAEKIAKTFWPGPLTMILRKSAQVPYETTGGLDTVAVRMPSHRTAQRLIAYGGGYVAAPSANISGKPSPTVAKYVREDMQGKIDVIIDGGEVGIGLESTILDLTVSPPQILRPGYITQEMLEEVLGQVDADETMMRADSGLAPKAPGMKYRHYAPSGELTIVQGSCEGVISAINEMTYQARSRGERVGIIATTETLQSYQVDEKHANVIKNIGSRQDEESIAQHLYKILREFDEERITSIFSESFGEEGFGQAIMNRLLKAAGHKVIKV